jgi:hypothetical protein
LLGEPTHRPSSWTTTSATRRICAERKLGTALVGARSSPASATLCRMALARCGIVGLGIWLAACTLARDTERFSSGPAAHDAGQAGASGDGGEPPPTGCASQVSASSLSTCALRNDGKPYCWGNNFYGQLGDGSKVDRSRPVEVQGFVGGVTQISVGDQHACAVKKDATLWCWGSNEHGQLGIGNVIQQSVPVKVPLEGVQSVSAGGAHSCALKLDGTLWCWGNNSQDLLGVPQGACTTTCGSSGSACCRSPAQVPGVGAPIGVHAASALSTATWDAHGTLRVWGLLSGPSPTELPGITSGVAQATQSGLFGAARSIDGSVWVWGAVPGGVGWLDLPTELGMSGVPSLADLAAGAFHVCAGTSDGVWCWGENCEGQRGDGSSEKCSSLGSGSWAEIPTRATNLEGSIESVAAGYAHTCARTAAAEIWCWGFNSYGQLGRDTTRVPLPVELPCP